MAKKSFAGEEAINHYGLVRLRIVGSGNLKMTFYSLDSIKSTTLADLALASTNNIEPTKLANFTQQRAQLQIKLTILGETFTCSKIVIFTKPVAASYPQ